MEPLWFVRTDVSQEVRRNLGWRGSKTICLEYRNRSFDARSLLYPPALILYHADGMTAVSRGFGYSRSHPSEYPQWSSHRHTDESDDHRLSALHHLYVVRVSRRVLCRMSYLRMARTKVMDEGSQKSKLYQWGL